MSLVKQINFDALVVFNNIDYTTEVEINHKVHSIINYQSWFTQFEKVAVSSCKISRVRITIRIRDNLESISKYLCPRT